ncbi:MAG: tetratricopeptide repeat protein [Cyclobacteriaceae bacterium]
MNKLFFWSSWASATKRLFILPLLLVLISVIGCFFATWFYVPIQLLPESEVVNQLLPFYEFKRFSIDFILAADFNLFKQHYYGASIQDSPLLVYAYLGVIVSCIALAMSAASAIKKSFWYYSLIGIVVFYLSQLQLDFLFPLIESTYPVFTALAVLVFIGVSYYSWISERLSFFTRSLLFGAYFILLFGVICSFSSVGKPVLFMAHHSLIIPSLLSLIIIFVFAQEIPRAILYLAASEKSESNSKNYFIGSAVYFVNVLVLYLGYTESVSRDFVFIHPYFLLTVSLVLGCWGVWKRTAIVKPIIETNPYGILLYLIGAVVVFSTLSVISFQDNTPLERLAESWITFTHFAFGLAFFMYVLVNFYQFLREGLAVYKVTYEGATISYRQLKLLVLLIVMVLTMKDSFRQPNLWFAGSEIAKADAHLAVNEELLSIGYHHKALARSTVNHKSNYLLARLKEYQEEIREAMGYYKDAVSKNPSVAAYLNLSNLYDSHEYTFDNIWTLEKGVKRFSSSVPLLVNMSNTYSGTKQLDSTFHYLALAQAKEPNSELIQANKLAIDLSQLGMVDTLLLQKEGKTLPLQNNQLVARHVLGKPIKENSVLPDSVLTPESFGWLRNYVLAGNSDISEYLHDIQYQSSNAFFNTDLELLEAINLYKNGQQLDGILLIDRLIRNANTADVVNYQFYLAMWYVEHRQYEKARLLFEKSSISQIRDKINEATFYAGFTNALLGNRKRAISFLTHPHVQKDDRLNSLANQWIYILKNEKSENTPQRHYFEALFQLNVIAIPSLKAKVTSFPSESASDLLTHRIESELKKRNFEGAKQLVQSLPKETKEEYEDKLSFQRSLFERKTHEATIGGYPFDLTTDSAMLIHIVQESPFDVDKYIAVSRLLVTNKKADLAYDLVVKGLELNPKAVTLQMEYCYLCADSKLFYFAEDMMEDIKKELNTVEFSIFLSTYQNFIPQK